MSLPRIPVPGDVLALIRESNLGYLHHRTEAVYRQLGEARRFATHGSMLGDDFVRCLQGEYWAGPGCHVYAFEHPRLGYSEYRQVGDMDLPAPGAEIYSTGSDWTLVTLVDLDGRWVLADAYVSTEPTERRLVGRVAA